MKAAKKPNLALMAAGVLLCLVLISSHFTSGLYARFITRAQGSDHARIASFRVDAEMESQDSKYTIKLKNDSETAVSYSLTVKLEEGVTGIAAVQINNKPYPLEDGKSVTIPNLGVLKAKEPEQKLLMSLVPVSDGTAGVGTEVNYVEDFSNDSTSSGGLDCPFTVTVQYSQVN